MRAQSPATKTLYYYVEVPRASCSRAVPAVRGSGGAAAARALVLEEEAEVVLGELGEGGRVAAHGALEDEPLLVLQGRGGAREWAGSRIEAGATSQALATS